MDCVHHVAEMAISMSIYTSGMQICLIANEGIFGMSKYTWGFVAALCAEVQFVGSLYSVVLACIHSPSRRVSTTAKLCQMVGGRERSGNWAACNCSYVELVVMDLDDLSQQFRREKREGKESVKTC